MRRHLVGALAIFLFATAIAFANPIAYVVTSAGSSGSAGQFGYMDLANGAFTPVGAPDPTGYDGVASIPGAALVVDGAGNLIRINPVTGAPTIIGPTGVSNLVVFAGLPSGALYATDTSNNLYRINGSTGAATLVGPTGLPAISGFFDNGLAGNATTLFYNYDSGSSPTARLYILDQTTGTATAVGVSQFGITGDGFVNNQLYGFTGGINEPGRDIYTIDTATGAATLVTPLSAIVFGAAQPLAAVPEPATLFLTATGLALLGCRRLWRTLLGAWMR